MSTKPDLTAADSSEQVANLTDPAGAKMQVAPDRQSASPEQLHAFALSMGIPPRDLPRELPESSRRLPLQGGYNFRDIGGYVGIDQRKVKQGLLWRSDHMNELTDDDLATIDALNLQVVHDFRLDVEVERQPSRASKTNPVKVIRLVVGDVTGAESSIAMIGEIMAGRAPAPAADFWDVNYLEMLENGRHMFVGLFTSLASPGSLPSVYHCTGGKDRTGIASMLLLTMLGVDRETAIDDFLLTNLYRTPFRIATLTPTLIANGVDPHSMIPILGVCRSAINVALDTIANTYGGAENYLIGGGLSPEAPARLRELLLD